MQGAIAESTNIRRFRRRRSSCRGDTKNTEKKLRVNVSTDSMENTER
jgi:hypothetical protein